MLYVKAAQARADAEFSLAEARSSARAGSMVAHDAVARAARAEEASVTLCDEARGDDREPSDAVFARRSQRPKDLGASQMLGLTALGRTGRTTSRLARGDAARLGRRGVAAAHARSQPVVHRARAGCLCAQGRGALTRSAGETTAAYSPTREAHLGARVISRRSFRQSKRICRGVGGGGRATTARRRRHCLGVLARASESPCSVNGFPIPLRAEFPGFAWLTAKNTPN